LQSKTGRSVSFGISLEPTWPIWEVVDLAMLSEKLGFSTVWVPDGGPAPPYSDCIVTLSAIASKTKSIRFGSAILNFYTRNPAWIASSFLALSDLAFHNERLGSLLSMKRNKRNNKKKRGEIKSRERAKQRAILGIGVGAPYNVAKFGISSRIGLIDDLREAIEAIRDLWNGKEVSVRTDSFAIERVTLSRNATGMIPIHVGSGSPKGLKLAGEIADGVILTDRIPSDIEESMKYVILGMGFALRARKELEITNSVVVSVDEDGSKAKRAARTTCSYLVAWLDDSKAEAHGIDLATKKKISEFLERGEERSAAKLVDDKMVELLTASGKPEECAEKCREHLSHGIDQIAFCEPFGPDKRRAIELIAKRIIPKLLAR
jgi:5,10-methylenetetrahydromethanopterin reductase